MKGKDIRKFLKLDKTATKWKFAGVIESIEIKVCSTL